MADQKTLEKLMKTAIEMTKMSYAPYSGFQVGAALLAKDGRIFTGCNVENAAYSPTNCAERTAFFKAVSEGARVFVAIAIAGGNNGVIIEPIAPCGVCRQVMMEFCNPETFKIYMAADLENFDEATLAVLLPRGFGAANLA